MDEIFSNLCNQIYQYCIQHLEQKQLTYTSLEVAELLHTSDKNVGNLRSVGILKGIKTGKGYVFSSDEIQRFLKDYEGYDVSNYEQMLMAKNDHKQKLRRLSN